MNISADSLLRCTTERMQAGVDEAGRGAMAGPVIAAAVILDVQRPVAGLADSKKLSPGRRETLAVQIRERALAWAVAEASAAEIDHINIRQASLLAMSRALSQLSVTPAVVLVDGCDKPSFPAEIIPIIGGDQSQPAISAASILAKVERDRLMCLLHERYPVYGFQRHKGYVTTDHYNALCRHGPSQEHRRSYAPVRRAMVMAQEQQQA